MEQINKGGIIMNEYYYLLVNQYFKIENKKPRDQAARRNKMQLFFYLPMDQLFQCEAKKHSV